MNSLAVALLLAASGLVAGCATPGPLDCVSGGTADEHGACPADARCPTPDLSSCPTTAPGDMVITGLVESAALVPLAQADVTIQEAGLHLATDAAGRFASPGLAPGVYTVTAGHRGYANLTRTARPEVTSLQFILDRQAPTVPYNVSLAPVHGVFECASETLIISGSCDALVQAFDGGTAVFHNVSTLGFQTDLGWKTIVMDLVFDADSNPGIAGMRETLRAQNASASLGTYEQYGRFYGATSFTTRIEPGQNYTDGSAPVPANVTSFHLDLYPQGQGWHTVCYPALGPEPADCFLGVGAAVNLRFDLYVTVFYVEPAPADWTLLGR